MEPGRALPPETEIDGVATKLHTNMVYKTPGGYKVTVDETGEIQVRAGFGGNSGWKSKQFFIDRGSYFYNQPWKGGIKYLDNWEFLFQYAKLIK